MREIKYELKSHKCVNSNWTARFLAGEEEWCQCSFGDCKVSVSIACNGHPSRIFILTEQELKDLERKNNEH